MVIIKCVIFAPHPDDEFFGCGALLFKWLREKHDVHIVYVSDNRAAYTFNKTINCLTECEETSISEDELAEISKNEVKNVLTFLKLSDRSSHLFWFPDQKVDQYIVKGVDLVKRVVFDTDVVVIPTYEDHHVDHRATHTMVRAAILNLNTSYNFNPIIYQYSLYSSFNHLSANKRIKIEVKPYLQDILKGLSFYKSQMYVTYSEAAKEELKSQKYQRFIVCKIDEMNS